MKIDQVKLQPGRRIQIPRRPAENWINCGEAKFAPLFCKRELYLDTENRWDVWTVVPSTISTDEWRLPENEYPNFYFRIQIKPHTSGFRIDLPKRLEDEGWITPSVKLIREVVPDPAFEVNYWIERSRRIHLWRENESGSSRI
jgi:hypothetical protein